MNACLLLVATAVTVATIWPAYGEAIGSLGNFDCVNDTGQTAYGCDHFGLRFAPTAVLGKVSYHWKVPNPAMPGTLMNAPWTVATPGQPL